MAYKELPQALEAFRAALAIRNSLSKADAENTGWERDRAVPYFNLADVFENLGEPGKALDALRAGQAIILPLTKVSPENGFVE